MWRSLLALVFGLAIAHATIAQNPQVPLNGSGLDLLFEAELESYGDAKPFALSPGGVGPSAPRGAVTGFMMGRDLIAQGDGTFAGPTMKGTLTWSKLNRKFVDKAYTSAHLVGFLEMEDGAEVMYQATGYGVVPNPEQPNRWLYTAKLTFDEPDAPYEWLTEVEAIWIGEFDVETGTARYWAYHATPDTSVADSEN